MGSEVLYKIVFMQGEEQCELYAAGITEDSLMGFVEVDEIYFNHHDSNLVLNTTEEKLKQKFKGVKTTYIPLHVILRIDVVSKPASFSDKLAPTTLNKVTHLVSTE